MSGAENNKITGTMSDCLRLESTATKHIHIVAFYFVRQYASKERVRPQRPSLQTASSLALDGTL